MDREKEVRYDPDTGEKVVTEEVAAEGVTRQGEGGVEKPTIIKRRAGFGTWLSGAIVGAIVAGGGYAYLAHQNGSYRAAGAVVDEKLSDAERATKNAAENAGDVAKDAGQKIENATDTKPDGK